jgi:hypothetical protein
MTINLPISPGFTNSRFGLETNTQSFTSPFTRAVQRVSLGGARWSWSVSLPAMNRDRAAPWKAFFDLLEGAANTFYGFDPDGVVPRGKALGNPLVNGASQTGSSLVIDGCTPNTTFLKAGDYFTVNTEYKRLTQDAIADGSGNATLTFKPALRNSPLDNAVITVDRPKCIMALVDDGQAIWECNVMGIYQPKTFAAIEVFS